MSYNNKVCLTAQGTLSELYFIKFISRLFLSFHTERKMKIITQHVIEPRSEGIASKH